ncbi:MAG: winged helix-turn-helix transcriptional regulator [Thermoplasmata archaeon]|nr:MAG: winged helix-turn-helix transcriptional regulator [Thermoplasmata archaeon]
MGEKIVLDSNTFKALASRTRLMILKSLDERQKTISELSKIMELNKATIYEHLSLLKEAGLVAKKESGNKWVYYKLTWKGVDLLHPEKKKIVILLSASIMCLIGCIFSYIAIIKDYFVQYTYAKKMVIEENIAHLPSIHIDFMPLLQGGLFLLTFTLFFFLAVWVWKKRGKGLLKAIT